MLAEQLGDLWICSCGNWVGRMLSWCPECCEDRNVQKPVQEEAEEESLDQLDR